MILQWAEGGQFWIKSNLWLRAAEILKISKRNCANLEFFGSKWGGGGHSPMSSPGHCDIPRVWWQDGFELKRNYKAYKKLCFMSIYLFKFFHRKYKSYIFTFFVISKMPISSGRIVNVFYICFSLLYSNFFKTAYFKNGTLSGCHWLV